MASDREKRKAPAKGLGAGLGALFGDAAEETGGLFLPISRIEPRRGQPRTVFDEAALAELADSIREHGVIQPITVRELSGGYYQIISGERRWRASRMAGLSEIPARIIEADDKRAMEMALVENLQREDLNPAEEARGYRTLMREYGMTQEEAAKRVGKSRPVVANALRLLTLPDEALTLLEEGTLAPSAARAVLEAPEEDRLALAEKAAAEGLTVREIEALIKKSAPRAKKAKKPAPDGVDYMAVAQDELTRALGRRVKIVSGARKSRIEIEFTDEDDFNAVYDRLMGPAAR